jgi:hypothetical protein
VEYAFKASSGDQFTDPLSKYALRKAWRALAHLSKYVTMRPDEIDAPRSGEAKRLLRDGLGATFRPFDAGLLIEPYHSKNSLF